MKKENNYYISLVEPTDFDSLKMIENVQGVAWDSLPDREIVPTHLLGTVAETGGLLLVARNKNTDEIIGFALAFLARNDGLEKHPGIPEGELFFASHMVAVLPKHQGGVGYDLKQAQKYYALRRGIRWMQWTYYPMLTKNGSLNFRKLGAQSYKFVQNKYGISDSGLYRGLPSDRLIVLWDMKNFTPIPFPHPQECVLLTRRGRDWKPVFNEKALEEAGAGMGPSAVICSVPIEFVRLRERDFATARVWQEIFGYVATTLLTKEMHWSVINFRISEDKEIGEYLFVRV